MYRYGSQFFITLGDDLDSLDGEHLIIGQVSEGMDVVAKLNEVLTDEKNRPYQDIRICHTVILDDPFPDPEEIEFPDESPRVTADVLASDYIAVDENLDDAKDKDMNEIQEEIAAKEAKAQATILEMVGDLPDADLAPPENVLFVCKLNPVTTSEDLEIIFSRFGKIICSEVIKDRLTGNSLQYAFIEFDNKKSCEDAFFKMDNVLIDDRRIHVDFSQSVSKIKWRGKGRGVEHFDDTGKKVSNSRTNDLYKQSSRDDSKPKSRFIDTAAYGKQYDDRQRKNKLVGQEGRTENRHRLHFENNDKERREWRDGRDMRELPGDKHGDHGSGRNKVHGHRRDHHDDSRDRREDRSNGTRYDKLTDKEVRSRDHTSHRRERDELEQISVRGAGSPGQSNMRLRPEDSVSTEVFRRHELMEDLRAQVKEGKKINAETSSNNDSESDSKEDSRTKKKKSKKRTKNKHEKTVDPGGSDSDVPKKKRKSKHKKRSHNSDLEDKIKSNKVKKSKH